MIESVGVPAAPQPLGTGAAAIRVRARNIDSGAIVADRVAVASGCVERATGLLTRDGLDIGEGLLIIPCRGVHTWGMRFSIDLIALDRSGRVVDAVSALRPWRIRLPKRGAYSVLELPVGALLRSQTRPGHRIVLESTSGEEAP